MPIDPHHFLKAVATKLCRLTRLDTDEQETQFPFPGWPFDFTVAFVSGKTRVNGANKCSQNYPLIYIFFETIVDVDEDQQRSYSEIQR